MVRNMPVSPMEERSFQLDSMRSFEIENDPTKPLKLRESTQADIIMKKSNFIKDKQKEEELKKDKLNEKELQDDKKIKLQDYKENQENIREIKKIIKKLFVFLLTNFGMLALVIGYIFGGAFLFQTLEQANERQNCETGQNLEKEAHISAANYFITLITFNISTDPYLDEYGSNETSLDGPDVYDSLMNERISELTTLYLSNAGTYRYYGATDCPSVSLWTMSSAVLWALTVVSTIGYGHVFPMTWEGQLTVICYATIGIPLYMITTAKISFICAAIFAFFYKCIVLVPISLVTKLFCKKKETRAFNEKDTPKIHREENLSFDWDSPNKNKVEDSEEDNAEEEEEKEEEEIRVPLFIILGVFYGFLIGGGFSFYYLEGWPVITSSYFTYVTMSTMGFGDYVPGITALLSGEDIQAAVNLTVSALFIFVGISVLGMVFSLAIVTVQHKISSIGDLLKQNAEEEEKKKSQLAEHRKNENLDDPNV